MLKTCPFNHTPFLPAHLPVFSGLPLPLHTDGARVLLPLPLHPLALADTNPHTRPVVPLLTQVTANHESMRGDIQTVSHTHTSQSQSRVLPPTPN